ncbi:MAG TPA: xanthine dehydrogenase family protein subunit M [Solirubrobacteraceae bacterium]|nr:xanthine dehydrogenase family protein subunit M [Solirubrobacteraceae bacterium]
MQVPAPFEYERATSVGHALELLRQLGPEARILAGGHSLLPMMKLRLAAPGYLVDIDGLAAELGYIRATAGAAPEILIGAMTRHRELLESPLLADRAAIFTDAERVIADPIVRNRGTIGGALCQADPSEDLGAVCSAIGAQVVVRGLDGDRVLDIDDFHRGPYRTAVQDDEMLVEIRVPLRARSGSAYEKVDRRVGDWAVAAAGAALTLDADGHIAEAGVALAAVGADIACAQAREELIGRTPSQDAFERAGAAAAAACSPVADQRGSVEYKRHVAGVLTIRALERAAARAQAEPAG